VFQLSTVSLKSYIYLADAASADTKTKPIRSPNIKKKTSQHQLAKLSTTKTKQNGLPYLQGDEKKHYQRLHNLLIIKL